MEQNKQTSEEMNILFSFFIIFIPFLSQLKFSISFKLMLDLLQNTLIKSYTKNHLSYLLEICFFKADISNI